MNTFLDFKNADISRLVDGELTNEKIAFVFTIMSFNSDRHLPPTNEILVECYKNTLELLNKVDG